MTELEVLQRIESINSMICALLALYMLVKMLKAVMSFITSFFY